MPNVPISAKTASVNAKLFCAFGMFVVFGQQCSQMIARAFRRWMFAFLASANHQLATSAVRCPLAGRSRKIARQFKTEAIVYSSPSVGSLPVKATCCMSSAMSRNFDAK